MLNVCAMFFVDYGIITGEGEYGVVKHGGLIEVLR
jgi:hypothetical protein